MVGLTHLSAVQVSLEKQHTKRQTDASITMELVVHVIE